MRAEPTIYRQIAVTDQMTTDQRKKEFRELFNSMPGDSAAEKIDFICKVLHCKKMTVQIWLVKNHTQPRIIPEAKLRILRDALAREASTTG